MVASSPGTAPKKQWAHVLLNRSSSVWPLLLPEITQQLDGAIAAGLSIDSPALAAHLMDVGFKTKSLACHVVEAATTHMDMDKGATLLRLLASRHASFALHAQDPLEHLVEKIDYEEMRPCLTPIAKVLLELGGDLSALVERRGLDWIRQQLEGNAQEELADFLEHQWGLLRQRVLLDEQTPPAPISARALPRL